MSLPEDLLRDRVGLREDAIAHLQSLLSDWQILADLSFADLLLWVPVPHEGVRESFLCVGQMRPYTAQTIYAEDLVGEVYDVRQRPMLGRAVHEQRVIRDADPDWSLGVPVREEAIPVRFRDEVVAVISREANVSTARSPSQLELTYLQTASQFAQMLADGTFPYPEQEPEEREYLLRVGDGTLRVDETATVTFASPNGISAYRRLGTLDKVTGHALDAFDPAPEDLRAGLEHGRPVDDEVERERAVIRRRLLPLIEAGNVVGGLLLVREVTELRRHERALRVKDATIREIHHRVKNNLQTVASLLRLQARRLGSGEARAALNESVRRITSIALVHETLSQESRERLPFGGITERIVRMLGEGLSDPDAPVQFAVEGDPGELPAEVATPLALVLTELLQNSVEHAFPSSEGRGKDGATGGRIVVGFERGSTTLRVLVSDDGVGMPTDLDESAHLGLRIARTLAESELGGTFEPLEQETGTAIELVLPLP
ncbi:ATPase [Egibacter rhizosphaerae]|uniref:histidine kinase n=1 Tax=Egibacter rhizosphaerae TaxID=1670831 RepID=A0A411YD65_9ACTN|nr:sensor histidine kinase [Egibacter rhizosphaerae]QBI19183.1 ATPase [Egibacter rhizosphaerae]